MPTAAQIRANQLAAQQKAAAAAKAAKAQEAVSAKQMATDARGIMAAAKAQAAAAAAKPPVAPKTPVAPAKPAPAPAPAPVQNPKIQIDQGYGNGIGYDGKPLYPDIRAGIGAVVGRPNGMVVLDPNYKGPTPTKVPSDTGTGGGIQTATPIQKNSVVQQGQGESYVRFGQNAPTSAATKMKKGGKVKSKSSYSSGGGVKSTASKRGDGIAQRGKTKGRMI